MSILEFDQPSTFEIVRVRLTVGRFTGIVIVIYRPGSAAVQQLFFDELAVVLDWIGLSRV